MKDMTQGSVLKHLLHMASFLAISMLVQTLYLLADLYWVGHLGKEAIAAVGVAGNIMMVVLALTQALGVGTTTVISHAAGAKDQPRAERGFNQSLLVATLLGLIFALCAFALRHEYSRALSADLVTADLSDQYLLWFIPSLMLQFPLVSLGSALRATGIIKPAVGIQILTVLLNAVAAPLLIFGIGPWPKLGITGAALATFIAVVVGNVLTVLYYVRSYHYLRFRLAMLKPQPKMWWAILRIGIPAGAEFGLMGVYIIVVYAIIRDFGAAAQAGFGIGARLMQAMFLPVVAISFAVAPVVGQNFGGRRADRVRQTFYSALAITTVVMVVLTIIAQLCAQTCIKGFSVDRAVIQFGGEYLRIISLNFVAMGAIFTSSSVFQGVGNTLPPLASSAMRLFLFAVPAAMISRMPGFRIRYVWYLSVISVLLQACSNLFLLGRELRKRLRFIEPSFQRDEETLSSSAATPV